MVANAVLHRMKMKPQIFMSPSLDDDIIEISKSLPCSSCNTFVYSASCFSQSRKFLGASHFDFFERNIQNLLFSTNHVVSHRLVVVYPRPLNSLSGLQHGGQLVRFGRNLWSAGSCFLYLLGSLVWMEEIDRNLKKWVTIHRYSTAVRKKILQTHTHTHIYIHCQIYSLT